MAKYSVPGPIFYVVILPTPAAHQNLNPTNKDDYENDTCLTKKMNKKNNLNEC
jgi:hypothetical protein